ncbi:MAG TPA: M20/M25/M40 family metallo-hydrolase [Kiritimatiellia bacterium]|nr:M20/M25/M40 family metallo-hydrolase [Kiritimatiellia bacterium]
MMEQSVEELLAKLVAVPSVNPEHSADPAVTGERRVADFIAGYLSDRGFQIEWLEKTPGRPNLIASYGPDDPKYTVLLEAHLDTVGIDGMTVAPFDPQIRDGRMYGRGTTDTKGPLAAALWALDRDRLQALSGASCRVIFIGAMGEETGNEGAFEVAEHGIRADEALILEPTEMQPIHTHKGTLWFRVELLGLSAHGSNPELGRSAILAMKKVIDALNSQIEADQHRFEDPVLGLPTLNIGRIHGGTALNIVPEKCVMDVDRRTLPAEDTRAILRRVDVVLAKLKSSGEIREGKVHLIKDCPAVATPPDGRLIGRLVKCCAETGVKAGAAGAAWYSDAGAFSAVCGETAVFGPGSIKQAHTCDEFIEISELHRGAKCLRGFFSALADDVKGMR